MPSHSEQQLLPFKTSELYALVADVEKYPEFLPWCKAARVSEVASDGFLGELLISYKHITESYVSKVALTPPASPHAPCAIAVSLVRGPFKHLTNHWRFEPEGEHTRIHFTLDFAFKFKLLEKLMSGFFQRANEKMVGAFTERAKALYR
jgi:coenzyme Q-binding protein COQ10